MTITSRDASILQQVAFKAAVEAGDDVLTDDGLSSFATRMAVYAEQLFDGVAKAMAAAEPPARQVPTPAPSDPYDAAAALGSELGATYHVEIVGQNNGPIPAWALKELEAKGITRAYDNRHQIAENPSRPHFKCVETGQGVWPDDKPKTARKPYQKPYQKRAA